MVKILHFFRCYLEQICVKFDANLALKLKNIDAETATSNDTILDEFSEQHKHQSIKKAPYLMRALLFYQNRPRLMVS